MKKTSVLFVCVGNSCRSQMAEGWLKHFYPAHYDVYSAGLMASHVHPAAIAVMKESGIDISGHSSKCIDEFFDKDIDIVVTLCDPAKESCPYFPNAKKLIHKSFDNPDDFFISRENPLKEFRRVRDEISTWVKKEFNPKE